MTQNAILRTLVLSCLLLFMLLLGWVLAARRSVLGQAGNALAVVSAANSGLVLAPESIAAAYGTRLATRTEAAGATLPTALAGTTVRVNGELAQLFFVSAGQVNFLIPAGVPAGTASIVITAGDGTLSTGTAQIATVAPALFTANANGKGALAAVLLRRRPNTPDAFEPLAQLDPATNRLVARPFLLGAETDQLFLILFLTGLRQAPQSSVRVNLGGVDFVPDFAGKQGGLAGVDQINLALPRSFGGRGVISLFVKASGAASSNAGEFAISGELPPTTALELKELNRNPVLAGEEITLTGSGFAANPNENSVQIVSEAGVTVQVDQFLEVSGSRLRFHVPFGAGKGSLRVKRGQTTEASLPLNVRTSVSGFIERFAQGQRVAIPGARIQVVDNPNSVVTAKDNGSFVMPDLPVSQQTEFEILPPANGALNFPNKKFYLAVRANRDNQLLRGDEQTLITGAQSLLADEVELNAAEIARNESATAQNVTVTLLSPGRTPANLPVGHFSSAIAQVTPFGAISPGIKLTLPNRDNLPVGTVARLFKLNQTRGSTTSGEFIDIGTATVTANGVETAANAITEGSFYFASIIRPLAAINGRALESDGRPVPRAIVQARGQSTFTDGFGGFVLPNVPVLSNGEKLRVEVSYQRPNGSISRKDSNEVELTAGALVTASPSIVLDAVSTNLPPVFLVPATLTLETGDMRDFDFVAQDPDSTQTVQVTQADTATSFTTLTSLTGNAYRLRMTTTTATATGNYKLLLTAVDSAGLTSSAAVTVTVTERSTGAPVAQSQAITTLEDMSKAITLVGRDPANRSLTYTVVSQPARGCFVGSDPNVCLGNLPNTPNLIYKPAANFNGLDSFSFKVSNGSTESALATVLLAVSAVNDAPSLSIHGVPLVNAGETLNLLVTATDADDGQLLRISAEGVPTGAATVQTNNTSLSFNWTPTYAQAGSYTVRFAVTDGESRDARDVTIMVDPRWTTSLLVTDPNENDRVNVLLNDGQGVVYAGTARGVLRSVNEGQAWVNSSVGLPNAGVRALALFGLELFAGTDGSGVYRSTNQGQTWTAVNSGLTNQRVLSLLAVRNNLYAGTIGGGVFRLVNGATSWNAASSGLGNAQVLCLASRDQTIFAGTDRGLYFSNSEGQNWTLADTGLSVGTSVNALIVKDNALYVATSNGVYKTNGASLILSLVYSLTGKAISFSPSRVLSGGVIAIYGTDFSPNVADNVVLIGDVEAQVLAATTTRLFVRVPSGARSAPIRVSTPQFEVSSATRMMVRTTISGFVTNTQRNPIQGVRIRYKGTNIQAMTNAEGAFLLADVPPALRAELEIDAGASGLQFPSIRLSVRVIEGRDNNLDLMTILSPNPLSYSLAHSKGISQAASLYPLTAARLGSSAAQLEPRISFTSLATIGNTLIAGTEGKGAYLSANNGQTWTPINTGLASVSIYAITAIGESLVAGAFDSAFRLSNNVQTWTVSNNGLTNQSVNTLAAIGSNLFAGTLGDGVFGSNDQGQTWKRSSADLPEFANVQAFGVNSTRLLTGVQGAGVFLSDNAGQNWRASNSGLTSLSITSFTTRGGKVFAGAVDEFRIVGNTTVSFPGGVSVSDNGGATWAASNNGLTNRQIRALALITGKLFAGTDGGGIYISEDEGGNWRVVSSGLAGDGLKVRDFAALGDTIFAATEGSIYRSTNGGESWELTPGADQLPQSLNAYALAVSGNKVYAGTRYGVFVTTNGGVNWKQVNAGLLNTFVTGLAISGDQLYASTASGGVFVSRIP